VVCHQCSDSGARVRVREVEYPWRTKKKAAGQVWDRGSEICKGQDKPQRAQKGKREEMRW